MAINRIEKMDNDKLTDWAAPPEDATRQEVEAVIRAWRSKREERLAAEKISEKLKEEEAQFKDWLVEVFKEQKLEGMIIDGRITGANPRDICVVEDREAFVNFLYETKSIDLLQFRLSDSAIFGRLDEGVVVPGIGKMEVYNLFDRKA